MSPDSSAYEAGGRAWGENFPSGGEELESDDDDSYSTGSSETDTEVEQEVIINSVGGVVYLSKKVGVRDEVCMLRDRSKYDIWVTNWTMT